LLNLDIRRCGEGGIAFWAGEDGYLVFVGVEEGLEDD